MNERYYDVSTPDLIRHSQELRERRQQIVELLGAISAEQEQLAEELQERARLDNESL